MPFQIAVLMLFAEGRDDYDGEIASTTRGWLFSAYYNEVHQMERPQGESRSRRLFRVLLPATCWWADDKQQTTADKIKHRRKMSLTSTKRKGHVSRYSLNFGVLLIIMPF